MERLLDIRLWLLLGLALVWISRARLALRTLTSTPVADPHAQYPDSAQELVTVIIPAKNEEKNIRACVQCFLAQDYPRLEILVANDGSTDQTEAILKSLGAINLLTGQPTQKLTPVPLRYLNITKTPPGWTGKNYAIHSAISYAKGSWLLFTDADTQHLPASVSTSISHAESKNLSLLTLIPRCLAYGFWENLLQPTAMGYLGLWFPPDKINDPHSGVHFANGQYLLIRRSLYQAIGGHENVAGEFLEDFGIMKQTRSKEEKAECAFGTGIYGTRMYDSFLSIWRGWRRIYLHAFERKGLVLFKKALGIFLFSVLPFLCFPFLTLQTFFSPETHAWVWGASVPVLIFILGTAWKTYGMVRANRLFSLLMPAGSTVLMLILLDAARMAVCKTKTKWR